jgi:hypothetical protein
MSNDVLVFSIATNGYGLKYGRCIDSHREYARINGYNYVLVDRPHLVWPFPAHDSAWLKIPLILAALARGYDWVLFLDADCEVRPGCPRVETVQRPGKVVYAANGHSERPNSGVIIVRNSPDAVAFFRRLLDEADDVEVIPTQDRAPYEKGHFIHYSKQLPSFDSLDSRWNNTNDLRVRDFGRHYIGPMRAIHRVSWSGRRLPPWMLALARLRYELARRLRLRPEASAQVSVRMKGLGKVSVREFRGFFSPRGTAVLPSARTSVDDPRRPGADAPR